MDERISVHLDCRFHNQTWKYLPCCDSWVIMGIWDMGRSNAAESNTWVNSNAVAARPPTGASRGVDERLCSSDMLL
jgi:hypothetical protein